MPPPPTTATTTIATRVRFLVVGLCTAMAVLLYLTRFAISPATDTMLRELSLSKTEFGQAVGAFFLAYALMQIPSGWVTDTLGARWMLALYVASWSLATIGLGFANGLAAIWTMRLVLGIAQAGAYPTAAGLLKRWVPYSSRGVANSIVSMGGRAGLLLSLAVTVPLMMLVGRVLDWETGGWRVVFALYGLVGLVWAAMFLWLYRNRPEEHPACNEAEVELINAGKPGGNAETVAERESARAVGWFCLLLFGVNIGWIVLITQSPGWIVNRLGSALLWLAGGGSVLIPLVNLVPEIGGLVGTLLLCLLVSRLLGWSLPAAGKRLRLPLAEMFRSKEVWLMCVIQFCVNIGWIFLATWLPQYLVERHGGYLQANLGDIVAVAAWITAVVNLAAIFGGLSGGRATDLLVRRFGPVWGRRLPGMTAGGLVCLMYLVVPTLPGLWPFVAAMIAIAFTIDFGLGATWASYQDIGGRHVASVLGIGNMCGNLGAAYFGRMIGYLADQDQWNVVFLMSAGAMALAAGCWLLFDASRPVTSD